MIFQKLGNNINGKFHLLRILFWKLIHHSIVERCNECLIFLKFSHLILKLKQLDYFSEYTLDVIRK